MHGCVAVQEVSKAVNNKIFVVHFHHAGYIQAMSLYLV
jgi:hypothetical protein